MFTASKVLHVSHVIAAKALTGKAVISVGMLAGTVATGYVAGSGVLPNDLEGVAVLLNHAALTESPTLVSALADVQARQNEAALTASINPSIPHLTVSSHRMTRLQKAEYDAGNRSVSKLAEK